MGNLNQGNNRQVALAGARKKWNRAEREVLRLEKLTLEDDSPELIEKLVSARQQLNIALSNLVKLRGK